MKLLIKLVWWIFFGLFLLFVLLFGLLFTNKGFQFVVNQIPMFVSALKFDEVNGKINNFSLTNLVYADKQGIDFNAKSVNLSLDLNCLKTLRICVNEFQVNSPSLKIDSSLFPPSEESEPLQEIKTPISINLKHTKITNFSLDFDHYLVKIGEFDSSANWEEKTISLNPTNINDLFVSLPKNETDSKEKNKNEKQSLEQTIAEIKTLFSKPLIEKLPIETLPINVLISSIKGKNWNVELDKTQTISSIELQGKAFENLVKIDKFIVLSPDLDLNVKGSTIFEKKWPVLLQLTANIKNQKDFPDSSISAGIKGDLLNEILVSSEGKGIISLKLDGKIALGKPTIPTTLSLSAKEIIWPLNTDKPDYRVKNAKIALDGTVNKYQLLTSFELESDIIPVSFAELNAHGSLEDLTISALKAKTLGGEVGILGKLSWLNNINWKAQVETKNINLATYIKDYPLSFSGKTKTEGSWNGDSWNVIISDLNILGKIDKEKVAITADLSANSKAEYEIKELKAIWGENSLKAEGQTKTLENISLKATVNAKNLSQILPDLKGNIIGDFAVKGSQKNPIADLNFALNNVQFQDWSLNKARLQGKIAVFNQEKFDADLVLKADKIKNESIQINSLDLSTKGNEKDHKIKLNLKGKPVSAMLDLAGNFDTKNKKWQGTLSNTKIDTPAGIWALDKNVHINVNLNNNNVSISQHCWNNKQFGLCLPKEFVVAPNGGGEIVLKKIDLKVLNDFVDTKTARFRGEIDGFAKIKWGKTLGIPDLELSINGDKVAIFTRITETAIIPLRFETISLNAKMKNDQLDLNFLTKLVENGGMRSTIKVSDLTKNRKISGSFIIDSLSLTQFAKPFLQMGDQIAADLNGNLALGGSLTNPLVNGKIALENLYFQGALLPISIDKGNVQIQFNGNNSTLNGVLVNESNELILTGNANWRDLNAWRAQLSANGENLHIVLDHLAEVRVSPNVQIIADKNALTTKGTIDIPWARIEIDKMGGGSESFIDVSSDEVMLNADLKPLKEKTAPPMKINSELKISLGNNIEISGYGLFMKLMGDLYVRQNEQGLGLHGTINIPEGSFHAYGQNLLIDRGELVFNGPVADPRLDIEAIRNPDAIEDDVTAGIKVTGFASEPVITLFSDPSMTNAEILSYVLRGEGLEDGDEGDNDMMIAMLIGVGASQSGKYIGEIGQMFGVSNFSVDTKGSGDSSQVTVGGNLSKNLRIQYGIGIFDSLATITIRYRLLPKLYLEATSSLDQTIDLIYNFDF